MATAPCSECGERFTLKQAKQTFCCPAHKLAFHNRSAKRGKQLVPLLMAWRGGRSTKTAKAAFNEACRLISKFSEEDKAAGRPTAHEFVDRQYRMFLRT